MAFNSAFSNKKAQVTLFVILAILIVAGVALFLYLKPELSPTARVSDPSSFLEKCMKDSAQEAVALLSTQGGSVQPTGYVLYDNNKVSYLCYTNDYYTRCVNQQPLMKYDVETAITSYVTPKFQACVGDLKQQLEGNGYTVETGSFKLSTTLQPKKVIIEADMSLTVSKEDTARYEKYQAIVLSPLYQQVILAQEIVNSETRYGDFDQLSYMLFNSETSVDKRSQGENTVYVIKDRPSDKRFLFAVRSYVLPPGF